MIAIRTVFNWGGPANGGARFSTFYASRNGLVGLGFYGFRQCQWRFWSLSLTFPTNHSEF